MGWNDRDVTDPFVDELESLFERYNPHYNRNIKQYNPINSSWADVLTQSILNGDNNDEGGSSISSSDDQNSRFELLQYKEYPNPVQMTVHGIVQLCRKYSYVRAALTESELSQFESEVTALAKKLVGENGTFTLNYTTRTYHLERAGKA